MKYTLITQKCGCHLLVEALMRSVNKHLQPDEILVADNLFIESVKSERHGLLMNGQVAKARNDCVLIVDHDVMLFDNSLIEQMLLELAKPNTFACGTDEYSFEGVPLLLPNCVMINKKMFLENNHPFDGGGNPCWDAFKYAHDQGQRLVKIDAGNRMFHLGSGVRSHYTRLTINGRWRREFEAWKSATGSTANFDVYVVDDGMDVNDLHQLNNIVLQDLAHKIKYKLPFSTIRLGDLGLRYLDDYFHNQTDFTHVGKNHSDIAMPNDEIGRKLTEELIDNMRQADWIDHPHTYKGVFNDLYNWRSLLGRCDEIYSKAGIVTPETNYCASLQGYLGFVKDFEWTLYDIMEDLRVMFVGPYDTLGELNTRRDLNLKEYKFYQLSMDANHMERYNVMDAFTKNFDPNYWDLVVVSGSLYGRTIVGRVRAMGGRSWDIGQAVHFFPNNIFETVVEVIDDRTFYKLKDGYTNYEHRGFEKYRS